MEEWNPGMMDAANRSLGLDFSPIIHYSNPPIFQSF
jgi:hypothetical protein